MTYGIGNRIRTLRIKNNLTQSDIAKLLDKSERIVSFYESNERDMGTETLIKLSKIFNCTVDYILGLTDNTYQIESDNDKIGKILELVEGLNIQETIYLIEQLNQASIKLNNKIVEKCGSHTEKNKKKEGE